MVNQAKLKTNRTRPVYKYGYQVPRHHEEAVKIDEKYGNTKWQDAERLEIQQLFEYEAFEDKGLGAPIPEGYTKIPCHFVYDVKHDGRHKARMVAGGHRTSTPTDSVYSGVVSLAGIRAVTFLAELNDLEIWGTDIGNAYLESYTKEKVAFIAGPEFGELQGHLFIIIKALYGLKSSGARWHDRLFDALTIMGFKPSRADPDIWMRDKGDHYEYIAVYVDDLLIASKAPQSIINALEAHPNLFKLKGTGPISFHLGCDFYRDDLGTLCMGPKTYIERLCLQYVAMFGTKPKSAYTSPLASNDHPELDDTELLDDDGIQKYQSLLGVLQWTISLGRFDIATAVMTMSGFRTAPRIGHLDRLKRVCGYLSKMKNGCIRVRTEEPDYSDMNATSYDWARTVYGQVTEELPKDAPMPKGKSITLTSYVDANLHHDMITGRSVTAVLHFANQTPIDWFSKKQATVETATYGSEFVAAKMAVQQVMGLRVFFRYLGVNINGPTHLFGDNESVVTSGSFPHSPLRKRHHALSYHYSREAIASGAVDFQFIPGHLNPADILSKHWGYQQVWTSALRPILFWKGDTSSLLLDSPPCPDGENRYCESEGMINRSTPSTMIAGSEVQENPQLPPPAINPTQLS
jgi:Reverse transcriptase (RNA-dependent DNA polymerase)